MGLSAKPAALRVAIDGELLDVQTVEIDRPLDRGLRANDRRSGGRWLGRSARTRSRGRSSGRLRRLRVLRGGRVGLRRLGGRQCSTETRGCGGTEREISEAVTDGRRRHIRRDRPRVLRDGGARDEHDDGQHVAVADLQRDARLLRRAFLLRRPRGQPDRSGERGARTHLRVCALRRGAAALLQERPRRWRHRHGQRPLRLRQPHSGLDRGQTCLLQQQAGVLPGHSCPHGRGRRPAGGRIQLRRARRVAGGVQAGSDQAV